MGSAILSYAVGDFFVWLRAKYISSWANGASIENKWLLLSQKLILIYVIVPGS